MRLPDSLRKRPVLPKNKKGKPERDKEPPRELLKPPESLLRLKDRSKLLWPKKRLPGKKSKS